MRRKVAIVVAALAAALFVPSALSSAPRAGAVSGTPVVVIMMENHAYDQIVGSSSAPYINHTFIPSGTLYTNYKAITHPSLPNYLALASGSTQGCTSDSCPTGAYSTPSIFKQLQQARLGWRSYQESMSSNCQASNSGQYVVKHNPAVFFSNIACANRDVPYPGTLPLTLKKFSFVTPNICNDMHDCSVATGDTWLSNHVPAFLSRGAIVVVVFDEDDFTTVNHVFAGASGPGITAGVTNGTAFTHYSLLAGIEDHFGLARIAGAVGKAPVPLP